MATSSFSRQFELKDEKVCEYVTEMIKKAPQTLSKDFKSKLVSEKEVREKLMKSLNN